MNEVRIFNDELFRERVCVWKRNERERDGHFHICQICGNYVMKENIIDEGICKEKLL